ncbi:MAG TPA: S1 RNA-binding domain-containing protein, partial [Streptosporangiaceae bacterium]|nr:S1 RNA-binding domain-containing protein [Streptosporangiaceae bacterium]
PADFTDDRFGLPTVTDILRELEKPGRDPRPAFTTATFAEGVESLADLTPGMVLEGVVTNVAAFGAFVDVGVHQDGLVHVSAMSRSFVSDPRQIAKPGDIVKVKVVGVDIGRKRISLSMRLDDEPGAGAGGKPDPRHQAERSPGPAKRSGRDDRSSQRQGPPGGKKGGRTPGSQEPDQGGAMAAALRRAGLVGGSGSEPGKQGPRGSSGS